ncbi:MAG: DivIVA domain-containing protein [Acidobacteria bacterium]|nr:DivIVA domain-containing protein [Acidobacteriota bacterium]
MRFTPMDITNRTFSRSIRGYDREEVKNFLQLVSEDLEALIAEQTEQKKELEHLKESLSDLRERENILKDTMLLAQETKEEIQKNAMKEAEIIVRESELQAERIIATAHDRATDVQQEIDELIRNRNQLIRELTGLIQNTESFLETLKKPYSSPKKDKD